MDIGAHAGALLLRLSDAGFSDLAGTDLDPTRFDVPGASFKVLELNQPFSHQFDRRFKVITCTDVIEHLESPRNFLSEARNLLEDDGYLAISLPNVAFWEGRLKFLWKGELWGFGERNYRVQRHISPSTFSQMIMMMNEVGLEVVEYGTGGSFATGLKWIATLPLWGPLRLIGGPHCLGESAVFLAKRAEPDAELKAPLHYRDRWRGIPDRIGLES
jgi:SAM-dependent methyltransferase